MDIIFLALVKFCYIVIGFVFLKSNFTKIKKPILYYYAIKSYNLTTNRLLVGTISSILISAEALLALLLLTTVFSKAILIMMVLHQGFYLFIIIKNLHKEFEGNCGCFPLNTPKHVTINSFMNNLAFIFIVFILFSIEQKISL